MDHFPFEIINTYNDDTFIWLCPIHYQTHRDAFTALVMNGLQCPQ